MKLCLETFLLTVVSDGEIVYTKRQLDISNEDRDPDQIVNEILTAVWTEKIPCVVHSTSWRHDRNGGVILTYMIYSDHFKFDGLSCKRLSRNVLKLPESKNPLRPRPTHIREEDVVLHGLRHLSFHYANGHETVCEAISKSESRSLFHAVSSGMAGRID